jgi:hypothetical protein
MKTVEEIRFTGNGHDALRRFQDRTHTRLLWLDAICIDQKSIVERNHQVSIMATVYSRARRVLVWLPSDEIWPINSPQASTCHKRLCHFQLLPEHAHRMDLV